MSFRVLMALTVVEVLVLVAVLTSYLSVSIRHLRASSATLAKIVVGVRTIRDHMRIGASVRELNGLLNTLANEDLPALATLAEDVAAGRQPGATQDAAGDAGHDHEGGAPDREGEAS